MSVAKLCYWPSCLCLAKMSVVKKGDWPKWVIDHNVCCRDENPSNYLVAKCLWPKCLWPKYLEPRWQWPKCLWPICLRPKCVFGPNVYDPNVCLAEFSRVPMSKAQKFWPKSVRPDCECGPNVSQLISNLEILVKIFVGTWIGENLTSKLEISKTPSECASKAGSSPSSTLSIT